VEVRRVMIVEVHSDDDPKEPRDLRHGGTVRTDACLRRIGRPGSTDRSRIQGRRVRDHTRSGHIRA
jgi:hypothetical protein